MNQFGLPIYDGPVDHLRQGLRSLEAEMQAPHPIQGVDKQSETTEFMAKIERVRRVYGSHMAMRLATEEANYGAARRLPGLPSSRAMHDTLTGAGTRIEFRDFLDDPLTRATAPTIDYHRQTEVQRGITL